MSFRFHRRLQVHVVCVVALLNRMAPWVPAGDGGGNDGDDAGTPVLVPRAKQSLAVKGPSEHAAASSAGVPAKTSAVDTEAAALFVRRFVEALSLASDLSKQVCGLRRLLF